MMQVCEYMLGGWGGGGSSASKSVCVCACVCVCAMIEYLFICRPDC